MIEIDKIELIAHSKRVEVICNGESICSIPIFEGTSIEFLTSDVFKRLFCFIYNDSHYNGYEEGIIEGKSILKTQISRILDKSDGMIIV